MYIFEKCRFANDVSPHFLEKYLISGVFYAKLYILFDENKVYLFNAAKINGETKETGGDTWNMFVEAEIV